MQRITRQQIRAKCVADADVRRQQILSAMARNLPEIGRQPVNDAECIIVCSGPSIKQQVAKIKRVARNGGCVIAVKAAHDFLIDNDIRPHMAFGVDPMPHIISCWSKRKQAKKKGWNIGYVLASQVHPDVFQALIDDGCDVILTHLLMKSSLDILKGRFMLGGGSSSGLRAMSLAWTLGFRKGHVFGMDGSLTGQMRKIDGTTWGQNPGEEPIPVKLVAPDVGVPLRRFMIDPAFLTQSTEFQDAVAMLPGAKWKFYGSGIIPMIAKIAARRGTPGYIEPNMDWDQNEPTPMPDLSKQAKMEAIFRSSQNGYVMGERYAQV